MDKDLDPGYSTLVRAPSLSPLNTPFFQGLVLRYPPPLPPTIRVAPTTVRPAVVADERAMKIDWRCQSFVSGHPWNHARFCKIVDSRVPMDLSKGFSDLGDRYILDYVGH